MRNGIMSELFNRIKEFDERLNVLDTMWSEYHSNVIRALELWHDLKREIQGRIAELQGLIEYCQERLKEVSIKAKIGLVDEKEALSLSEELRNTISESSETLSRLQEELKSTSSRIEEHVRRVALQTLLSSEKEFKEKVTRLESLYREGKIDKELYRKMRSLLLFSREVSESNSEL